MSCLRICLFVFFVGFVNSPALATSSEAAIELGNCKPWDNTKVKSEEDFAREEAEKSGLTKTELLARLIYSEALSTGYWSERCSAKSGEEIMNAIGWGIMNRVHAKAPAVTPAVYSQVVFSKNQFRTSFSGKKKNPFAEAFLCPLKSQDYLNALSKKVIAAKLYTRAQEIAQDIIAEYERNGLHEKYKKVTNFFYPKSEFFGEKRPAWAPHTNPTKNKGYLNLLNVSTKPCIEFYSL